MPVICVRFRIYHHQLGRPLWRTIHVVDGLDLLTILAKHLHGYDGPVRVCCY